MKKRPINEASVSRFIEAFFDGLKTNTADRILNQAAKSGVEPEIIKQMHDIQAQSRELEKLIRKYSK